MTKYPRPNPGDKFGKLTVVNPEGFLGDDPAVTARCECGQKTDVRVRCLRLGRTRSCGCLRQSANVARTGIPRKRKFSPEEAAVRLKFSVCRHSAHRRGLAFTLDRSEFERLLHLPCLYCGVSGPVGLDRVDNCVGYESQNVVPCCRICNVAKNAHPLEEFEAWFDRAARHRGYTR